MFAGELQKQKALFAASDCAALFGAFTIALYIHDPSGAMENRLREAAPSLLGIGALLIVSFWIVVFWASDLYRKRNGGRDEWFAIVKGCSIAAVLAPLAVFLAHIEVARLTVVLAYLLSVPLVVTARAVLRIFIRHLYASPGIAIPLVVVGFNPVARSLFDYILDGMTHYEPVGFLDDGTGGRQYRGYPVLKGPERLGELAAQYSHLEAAITAKDGETWCREDLIRLCEEHRVRWWMVPLELCLPGTTLRVDMLGDIPLVGPHGSNIEGLNFAIKRAFDITVASLLLVISAPSIAIVTAAVWLFDGRPVLFRQTRVGLHGRRFEMLKLRTMRAAAGDNVHREYVRKWIGEKGYGDAHKQSVFKLKNDERITRVGRILRRFSIDELPQLINVLRGDMSLIGPRPAVPYELELYNAWHRRRLDAMPGITGLWQVSGRNHLSFEEMVRLDVRYIEDWSLAGDLKILARTVPVLLRGQGI
jgi:exopolysaccharide biosynthesis polyprenyl glycosylphosphotransferase